MSSAAQGEPEERPVRIATESITLEGDLALPAAACGAVLFAHGSGSSRFSSRNRYVASVLNNAGYGTLLMDLLTPKEEAEEAYDTGLRFNIPLLANRLMGATDWLRRETDHLHFPVGYFGASTGAAAALIAAAEGPNDVVAVVSRGGRPDLAGGALEQVKAPTLLIVGSLDDVVLKLNRQAAKSLRCANKMALVPGATHLFEEPGALQQVAFLATEWFHAHIEHSGEKIA